MSETEAETTAVPRIRLVAGLGNPGLRYARTRHNLGFMVLDELARRHGQRYLKQGRAERARIPAATLIKPQTFMNLSGSAIQAGLSSSGTAAGELLVVHDDLDLPLGRFRFRFGGSAGGQRGVQDTISRIGKEFWRLKLGISAAPDGWETKNWVLSRFRKEEDDLLQEVISTAADAVEHCLAHGPESAANHFNGLDLSN